MITLASLVLSCRPTTTTPGGKFVQVTGRFDRDVLGLGWDKGGQYDFKNNRDAKCKGYPYYVQFIEPRTETYCLRCCQSRADCKINQFSRGCAKAMPGDYSYYS
jgi:hypothetical protein